MIQAKVKTEWHGEKVKKKMDTTTFETLNQAAAMLRLVAKRSIKRSKKESQPGQPPHTKTNRLPRSILFHVDRRRQIAVIGPSRDKIGLAGAAHEHGEVFRGDAYPARPYMAPALDKIAPRLPSMWAAKF